MADVLGNHAPAHDGCPKSPCPRVSSRLFAQGGDSRPHDVVLVDVDREGAFVPGVASERLQPGRRLGTADDHDNGPTGNVTMGGADIKIG